MKTMMTQPQHRRASDNGLVVLASMFLSMGALLPLYAILFAQG